MPWELTGNSGTNPATAFLGTTDSQPLVIRTNGAEAIRISPSGNVGLGTSPTSSKLEIAAQDGLQIHGFQPFLTLIDTNNNGARARIQTANGDIGFQTEEGIAAGSFVPAMKILNSGDVEFSGDIRLINAADCAEDFDICDEELVEPGTVMVLGEEGKLQQSQEAYDKRVAGVVSGAGDYKSGIVLDKQQSQSGRKPIALMGKVFCKVDAQYGAIEVGDLLTTAPTLGHAMKVTDPTKAFGAVIGKACARLGEGLGLIPILIALQ